MVSVCPQSDVLTLVCLIAAATFVKPKLYAYMAASVTACYDVQTAGLSATHTYHAARGCVLRSQAVTMLVCSTVWSHIDK